MSKYRRKCFNKEMLTFLKDTSEQLCHRWDCTLVEFGGEEDPVPMLISCHPSMKMSIFVNHLKTVTSRLTRKQFSKPSTTLLLGNLYSGYAPIVY